MDGSAAEVRRWKGIGRRLRFHALKKLHDLGQLNLIDAGKLQDCINGPLKGKAAVRRLLAEPAPGTFVFLGHRDRLAREQPGAEGDHELGPIIIEGIRLYDAVKQAQALVPDGCCLKPTGTEPVMRPDEEDPALFQKVWSRIGAGATPEECELDMQPDTYKVRLLLARWVEDLALTVA